MTSAQSYSAEDFRSELTHYMKSALHYAAMSAEQEDHDAVLPRRELHRLVRLQIPELFLVAELEDGVDRSALIGLAVEDFRSKAPKRTRRPSSALHSDAMWRSQMERLAPALARDISESCVSISSQKGQPSVGLVPECFPVWDNLMSALVYTFRVELLRSVNTGEFERLWWEDRTMVAMDGLATWFRLQRIPHLTRVQQSESAISCIAADACRGFVLSEFSELANGHPIPVDLPGAGPATETLCNLVRDWAKHPPEAEDIDSRIAIDLVLGRLDAAIEEAVENDAKRRSRAGKCSVEGED